MALSMVDGDKNRPVADAKGMPNRRECVEHTVICRYLSGEPVALQHCSTVVDMKVRVANIHDCFALDVVVLEDGVVLKDDHVFDEAPAEVQIIMLQDRVYSEDKWVKALLQHTVCGDVASVQKALGRMSEQAQKQHQYRCPSCAMRRGCRPERAPWGRCAGRLRLDVALLRHLAEFA
eukprot:GEMP01031619.1.p1 GENE.GEMP01031619.1~~GEMP01031619.1.p1  ORF type:complete len:177 (+),score=43.91 GEMP01031619.1:26-556(+)